MNTAAMILKNRNYQTMGAMMNSIQWKEKNNQGVLSLFNCDFHEYEKRLIYLYCLSPYNIGENNIRSIIKHLRNRAIKGRILPKPENLIKVFQRLAKRG